MYVYMYVCMYICMCMLYIYHIPCLETAAGISFNAMCVVYFEGGGVFLIRTHIEPYEICNLGLYDCM